MAIKEAKRQAVPLMIGLAGTSGSGKTFSALLMAAGLAGEGGKVGFIDTELGRGAMYADDETIIEAMPEGKYYISDMTAPFTPAKYVKAIKEFISYGVNVLVIDSATHEWEGSGGCQDIAENNKLRGMPNWAMAKMEHKKLMNILTQCPMHIISCLRAREKTKPVKNPDTGKIEMVQEGLQPIQEKNFMFDMTLSMMFDETAPGKPKILKCPKPLNHLFQGESSLVTKVVGEKLKAWSDGGEAIDKVVRNLRREFRDAAAGGNDYLKAIHQRVENEDKSLLREIWTAEFADELKSIAKEADQISLNQDESDQEENPESNKLIINN